MIPPPDFNRATQEIDALGRKVGFRRSEVLPPTENGVRAPLYSALWTSDYAYLLFWPIAGSSPGVLQAGAIEAEGWFDELLSSAESQRSDRVVDGYLIFGLAHPPTDEVKDQIRHLELSTRVCRKHFIWPSDEQRDEECTEGWSRVADVTALGLPDAAMAGTSELVWPSIDGEAEAVWTDLIHDGVSTTAQKDEAA
ncbi:hypothetical protein [Bradyrhizobium ottawaense]|uniref:hypothetical protein n=1 Tax=Bradyrhizobium ottawaense TaxID=931866 RepID=UPI001BA8C459|nr:hypothetical protein [Bradyrhizobium ottawaense]MBR1325704.1 hypothetical protein [Bradyrhizobium ottawaense]